MTWTPVLIALVSLTVLVQGAVMAWVYSKGTGFMDMSKMEDNCRNLASTLATVGFCLYTFITFFFGRNNLWKFVEGLPFQPVYNFARTWLAVPSGRDDLKAIYTWIWTVLAFVVPCMVFVMVNGALAAMLWGWFRVKRHDEV